MTTEGAPRTPSLSELLAVHADTTRRSVNVALPGRVEKYDSAEQKADVKPLVNNLTADRDGNEIVEELPVIPGVPIAFPRAGGFFLTLPVKAGDLVTLIVCDRSVDNYKSGRGVVTDPDDFRAHDWSDAIAIPGFYPFGRSVGDSGVSSNLVLGRENGAQIHVKPDLVSLYEENAAQFIALAQKTFDAIDALRSSVATNVTTNNGHTHTYLPGPGVLIPTGPPVPLQSSPPVTTSVAASKVKAT